MLSKILYWILWPFKWFWFTATLKLKLVIVGIVLILISIIFVYQSCKKKVEIDLESVDKINSKNEQLAKEELRKVVEENLEVIRTNDNRTIATATNIEERDRQINAAVAEAEKKVSEAKRQKGNVTQEELQCILVPADCF